MATNGTLKLDTNYIQTGLGTLTFTVPATLPPNGVAVLNQPFTVQCQVTMPQAVQEGYGSGAGSDTGLGVTGGSPTFSPSYQTTGAQQGLGNGQKGLGFGGTVTDGATSIVSGHGSGSGGGTLGGFSLGGGGLGDGAKGQAFGADLSGYNQPSANVTTPTSFAAILSSLSIVVSKNGTPFYTSPVPQGNQSALEFKTSTLASATDSITVVLSSSNSAVDSVPMNVIKANVSVAVGE